jgi:hypothetical protein
MTAWYNEAADREALVLMVQCLLPTRIFLHLNSKRDTFLYTDHVLGIEVTYPDLHVVNPLTPNDL